MTEYASCGVVKRMENIEVDQFHSAVVIPPVREEGFQEWCREWAEGVENLLKPGGHLLAFGEPNYHHRVFAGVEDAGFEIRDTVVYHHGGECDGVFPYSTTLVSIARKPLNRETVVDNVMEYGTGALDVGSCRVGDDVDTLRPESGEIGDGVKYSPSTGKDYDTGSKSGGRYPPNAVFDEVTARVLDSGCDETRSAQSSAVHTAYGDESMFVDGVSTPDNQYDDEGGPSRFFFSPTDAEDFISWLIELTSREGQRILTLFDDGGDVVSVANDMKRDCLNIVDDRD